MKNMELNRQLQRLSHLFKRTTEASAGDIEIQSHWAKYLCILCAGFLENSIRELFLNYVSRRAGKEVQRFADMQLSQIQNPKTSKFIEVTNSFNDDWGKELEEFSFQDGRKEAINSIMGNRHLIAHGKDSGITVVRLKEYFDKALEVLDFIELKLDPP